ncbi:hypothetical protein [Polaribacter sp. Hel_I_88]|uniref:hypothetical protein n=1 Tax=Polaribacter sp. Hel_I_88 TaxID=1250006 RepID=UPI00047DAE6C|nr:hypothetical protein [Polaribacter sp. Hel_I_88]
MTKRKTIKSAIILFLLIILSSLFYNITITKSQERSINSAKKIEIGMTYSEVFSVMKDKNVPCIKPFNYCDNLLLYDTHNDSFPYIEVTFDRSQKVKEVYIPKF